MAGPFLLALDQGTTSTRAILFDRSGRPVSRAARPLRQIFPQPGWVEHDPAEIAAAAIDVLRQVASTVDAGEIAALGITNQRETTVVWERATGRPVHNAIVWQDRRTAPLCARLREQGHEDEITAKTGLLLDPYFSASKIAWILEHVPGARRQADAGELAFGTIDSWLIWTLTGGRVHASDATNASRTMLFDMHGGGWDESLLALFDIPPAMLPEVRPCQADFGRTETGLIGTALPIAGVAGDQQAAAFGQACFAPGAIKATFGTGCFMLINTGARPVASRSRLLSTIADADASATHYALEGSIFMAGATIQWLRDGLGIISSAEETEALARQADPNSGVYLVPAFQGLGAPYWDAEARGAISGLTRAAGRAEIVRAGLEAIAFQTRDLLEAVNADLAAAGLEAPARLRADGGMVANAWFMQHLADLTGLSVDRAMVAETTALGAAFHAGLFAGVYGSRAELEALWRADATFEPRLSADERDARYAGWQDAVARVRR